MTARKPGRPTRKPGRPPGRPPGPKKLPCGCAFDAETGEVLARRDCPEHATAAAAEAPTPNADADADTSAVADADDNPVDRITAMIGRGREHENARVKVEKLIEQGQTTRLGYCKTYTPEEFEAEGMLDGVRRRFGSGRYKIQVYALNQANGKFEQYNSTKVDLISVNEDPLQARLDSLTAQLAAAARPAAAPANPAAPADPMASLSGALALLLKVKELIAPPPPPAPVPLTQQLGELVNLIRGTRELAGEIDPSAAPPDPLFELGKQALPIIAEAVRNQPHAAPVLAPVALPPTLATPGPVVAVPSPAAIAPERASGSPARNGGDVNANELAGLRQAIGAVNTLAAFQMDAAKAADMIFDQMPDEALAIVQAPDWWARLLQIAPECAQFEAWYAAARAELLKIIEEEAQAEPGGDAPVAGNGHAAPAP